MSTIILALQVYKTYYHAVMCTARKGTRKEMFADASRRQIRLDKAMRDQPDLRNMFPELVDAISKDRVARGTFEKLISDGCAPRVLLWLLNVCVQYDGVVALWKKDLDSLKSQFDGLIGALENLSAKVISLNEARILEELLWKSPAFDSIDGRVRKNFARHYMSSELPGSLIVAKAFLQELKQNIAEEHSVRLLPLSKMLGWLYLYCCAGAGRRVTYREIADLLNAGFVANASETEISESTVRMALLRFKGSAAAMSYESLGLLMKDYVRSCPNGSPTLDDWLSSKGVDWLQSHIKTMVPGRVISEKERRRLTLAERKRPRK